MTQRRCSGVNKQGDPCRAPAMDGGAWCVAHDPNRVVELAEWRKRGGKARSNASRAKRALPAEPLSAEEIHSYLGIVFRGVIAGKIEPGIGTAAASIARAMMDVAKVSDFEAQLAEMRRDLADLAERGA